MNDYRYRNYSVWSDRNADLSRADLWIAGILLGLLAAGMAAGLPQAGGIGDTVWAVVATVVVAAGAATSFWLAAKWDKEPATVNRDAEQADSLDEKSAAA
jgi:hypothetical protein